jgi:hypothetical protein
MNDVIGLITPVEAACTTSGRAVGSSARWIAILVVRKKALKILRVAITWVTTKEFYTHWVDNKSG